MQFVTAGTRRSQYQCAGSSGRSILIDGSAPCCAACATRGVIQIYGGCVRIRSEHGDRLFHCEAELCSAMVHHSARSSA